MFAFAIASIDIEREVLIRSELIKSFDCIDQFDTEIIRNGLILSKITELKILGREKLGHSNRKYAGLTSASWGRAYSAPKFKILC